MLESSKIYGALKFFSTQHEYIKIDDTESIKTWCKYLKYNIKRIIKYQKI